MKSALYIIYAVMPTEKRPKETEMMIQRAEGDDLS